MGQQGSIALPFPQPQPVTIWTCKTMDLAHHVVCLFTPIFHCYLLSDHGGMACSFDIGTHTVRFIHTSWSQVMATCVCRWHVVDCFYLMSIFWHFRQLLSDCGIGLTTDTSAPAAVGVTPAVNQHRVLIFCQLKSMLDIVECDLFQCVLLLYVAVKVLSSS